MLGGLLFAGLAGFHLWAISVGWQSGWLPGNEFRQTQTAITAHFIQQEHNFSLAYPTPVLGKPWSVPFEFPLYQWAVVIVSNSAGMGLVEAARFVSAVCFYLTLPAVWLLLGRLQVERGLRWVVLGFIVSCPLYIFYARAFLIETMALMFSVWFLFTYVTAVERRSGWWLVAANIAGIGAGLVKVTTFIVFLLPAGAWTLAWCWRAWRTGAVGRWPRLGGWIAWAAGAVALPFAATYGWVVFADSVKARNAGGAALLSSGMHDYNWGTWQTRLSPEVWKQHWLIHQSDIASWGVLAAGALVIALGTRWRWWSVAAVAVFVAAQAMFPILYAWHEYYYVANTILLMMAIGLGCCGLLASRLPAGVSWLAILALHTAQLTLYFKTDYPRQVLTAPGGTDLTLLLDQITGRDDVLVIAGEDWASMTPYYARRRALMLRRNTETEWPRVEASFKALQGERVSALLLRGDQRNNQHLRELATAYFGLDPTPGLTWRDEDVYLRPDLHAAARAALRQSLYQEVNPAPTLLPAEEAHVRKEYWTKDLPPDRQALFRFMSPRPERVYSQFGMSVIVLNNHNAFLAHPDTRLWFNVPPGAHTIRAGFLIAEGAYTGDGANNPTDGAEFLFEEERADGTRRHLFTRTLDPMNRKGDRGFKEVTLRVEIAAGSRLLLSTRPGQHNNYNHDWAFWTKIEIE